MSKLLFRGAAIASLLCAAITVALGLFAHWRITPALAACLAGENARVPQPAYWYIAFVEEYSVEILVLWLALVIIAATADRRAFQLLGPGLLIVALLCQLAMIWAVVKVRAYRDDCLQRRRADFVRPYPS